MAIKLTKDSEIKELFLNLIIFSSIKKERKTRQNNKQIVILKRIKERFQRKNFVISYRFFAPEKMAETDEELYQRVISFYKRN